MLEFDDGAAEAVVIDPPTIPMSRMVVSKTWERAKADFFAEPHS